MNRLLATSTACLIAAASAQAMAAARLSTQLSASRVEVGQQFTLQLSCLVDSGSGSPSEPRLLVPRGLSAQGPSISTQQNVSIINGQIQQQSGVNATWVLVASAPGRYRIGPASIAIGGHRQSDRAVEIEVVAAGTMPQPNRPSRRTRGFDPFDPFGGSDPFSGPMFPPGMNPFGNQTPPSSDDLPAYPPDLNTDKARDPIAFLDARLSSTRIVVGEQVTLRLYAYGKPGRFDLAVSSEPKRDDFLSYQIERDSPNNSPYRIKLDSEIWFARKFMSYALFPTKSGRLRVGEVEAEFVGGGLFGGGAYRNVKRKSQPIEVIVEEPPVAGRPPGYHLGDVGQFTLTANAEPKRINAGESLSVQVEVAGAGQLPQRLDPPEQTGVDWLEPTTTQQIDEQRDRIGGKRQFTYVVRIDRAGTIDLGTLRFHYFDPTTRKYATASAALGKIEVAAASATTSAPGAVTKVGNTSDDPLLAALHPRQQLGSFAQTPRYLAERAGFFYWLFAGPLLSLALFGLRDSLRRFAQWRVRASGSARVLVEAELQAARTAVRAGDPARTATSVERLVHLLIEHSVDLRSRAVLRAELAGQIESRGIDAETSTRLVSLLERCDHLKFVQASLDEARSLVDDASTLVVAMLPKLSKKQRRES